MFTCVCGLKSSILYKVSSILYLFWKQCETLLTSKDSLLFRLKSKNAEVFSSSACDLAIKRVVLCLAVSVLCQERPA